MENKKIRFPIAAIFVSLNCLFYVIGYVGNSVIYYNSVGYFDWSPVFSFLLSLTVYIAFCYILFNKKHDKILLILMILLIVPKIGNQITILCSLINYNASLSNGLVIFLYNLLIDLPWCIGVFFLFKWYSKFYIISAYKSNCAEGTETESSELGNKKIPITIIFFIIDCLITLFTMYSFISDNSFDFFWINLPSYILSIILNIALVYSFFKKKYDKIFLLIICLFIAPDIGGLVGNFIRLFYDELSVDAIQFMRTLLMCIFNTAQYYLLYKWFKDPYEKEKIVDENYNNTLDYNESYIDLVKHILLSLFTFGIWMLIWIYKTTNSLNKAPNSEKYDPTKKLLLCMFVPFYSIYWFYKHGEKIDKLNAVAGRKTDNTTMYLLLGIFIPVVACILMQDNINKLCTSDVNVAQASSSETTAAAVKDEKNITEALKEYKSLLDMGIITQEEFDAKKKQLLGL